MISLIILSKCKQDIGTYSSNKRSLHVQKKEGQIPIKNISSLDGQRLLIQSRMALI